MTTLNQSTKKAQGFINSYLKSHVVSIYSAYGKPSEAKVSAFERICDRAANAATPVYIISAGVQFFSTAYEDVISGARGLVVDTPSNTFFIPW